MRKPDAAPIAAVKASLAIPLSGKGGDAPVQLVCLALVLAVAALGLRIMMIW
ncbi:MAG TPA: hypothetical protein VGL45_15925 [Bradyrhizobium sp.]|jgi:hypothetical protein